jgi:protein-tyrosine phosphatase
MDDNKKIEVLFVCMGNICRSPTAHGVFEALVKANGLAHQIVVDSAGTHAYHVGEQPDKRSQQTALAKGIDLSYQRARKVSQDDMYQYDYIIAMDRNNYRDLAAMCPNGLGKKLHLFLDFAQELDDEEVPDPYYGGKGGFERVFNMVHAASAGLLEDIRSQHQV